MKAIWLEQAGGPDVLRYVDRPDPEPGPGEVRVRLKTAALNRRDTSQRKNAASPFPFIPGSDGAGIVDRVGPGVGDLAAGTEVVIFPSLNWFGGEEAPPRDFQILGGPTDGTHAELIVLKRAQIYPKPPPLTWEEAAAIPLAGLTAWRGLFTRGRLRAGETLLVTGIGGGVATFALSFGRLAGATVFVTSGDESKLARAAELGAAAGINYRANPAWSADVKKLTGGRGVDLILDSAGGEVWTECVRALRPGGRIVGLGMTTGEISPIETRQVVMRQVDVRGTTMGNAREFEEMLRPYADGRLRPIVDRVYPLAQIGEGHRRMEEKDQFGKIVLSIS
ncbi:MAG TPA: zinc-binding dehydrogenase [Dehalococcoidia bacterium]|nr:zinc-binding dehydrogenase [Dehalococcoidia bacterium]